LQSKGHPSRPRAEALQIRLWISGGHRTGCDGSLGKRCTASCRGRPGIA
jgi:hypothetical protein